MRETDRSIAALAIPALGSLVAEPLFLLADSAMVGHLGGASLAGMAVASTILQTVIGLMIFLAYATTPAVARSLGAGDRRRAIEHGADGIWLATALGVVLAVIGALLSPIAISWFTNDPAVGAQAATYLVISWAGLPSMLAVLAATGTLRGLQDTRTPLLITAIAFTANIATNAVLIYGLRLGIAGSALGTVAVQWAMAAWMVALLVAGGRREGASFAPRLAGINASAQSGAWLLLRTAALRASLIATVWVAGRGSASELAGYQILITVFNVVALALDALAIAGQALIGKQLGARDVPGVHAVTRRLERWGTVFGTLFGVVILASSPVLGRVFTSDPSVLAIMPAAFIALSITMPIGGYAFVLDGVLIGSGDVKFLAFAMLVGLALFAPMLWAVDAWASGAASLAWLWAAFGIGLMAARAVMLGFRVHGDRWIRLT